MLFHGHCYRLARRYKYDSLSLVYSGIEKKKRSDRRLNRRGKISGKGNETRGTKYRLVYTRIDAAVYLCKQRIGHDRCGFVTVERPERSWKLANLSPRPTPSTQPEPGEPFRFCSLNYLNGVIFPNQSSLSLRFFQRYVWKSISWILQRNTNLPLVILDLLGNDNWILETIRIFFLSWGWTSFYSLFRNHLFDKFSFSRKRESWSRIRRFLTQNFVSRQ